MWSIIKLKKGERIIVLVDSLSKCNNRIKELRSSGEKGVSFVLERTQDTIKSELKTNTGSYNSGSYATYPPKVKKKK